MTDTDADVWEMGARLIKSTNCCLYHKILVSFCTMLEKQRNFPGRLPIALANAFRNIFLTYRLWKCYICCNILNLFWIFLNVSTQQDKLYTLMAFLSMEVIVETSCRSWFSLFRMLPQRLEKGHVTCVSTCSDSCNRKPFHFPFFDLNSWYVQIANNRSIIAHVLCQKQRNCWTRLRKKTPRNIPISLSRYLQCIWILHRHQLERFYHVWVNGFCSGFFVPSSFNYRPCLIFTP